MGAVIRLKRTYSAVSPHPPVTPKAVGSSPIGPVKEIKGLRESVNPFSFDGWGAVIMD